MSISNFEHLYFKTVPPFSFSLDEITSVYFIIFTQSLNLKGIVLKYVVQAGLRIRRRAGTSFHRTPGLLLFRR
jgi:hypothetical protein